MGEVGCWCVTFFALLDLLVVEAVQSSPCWRKMGENQRFGACWESFVSGGPPSRACWGSFVPGARPQGCVRARVEGRRVRGWPGVPVAEA